MERELNYTSEASADKLSFSMILNRRLEMHTVDLKAVARKEELRHDNGHSFFPKNDMIAHCTTGKDTLSDWYDVNKLKKVLERKRKTNVFLQSSEGLWCQECTRLSKKLKNVLISAKEVPPPPLKTNLSSVLRNDHIARRNFSKYKHHQQSRATAEILQKICFVVSATTYICS